jgi:WD40 repeat protein
MDWSPNGEFITAAGFRPGTPQALYVWDAETFELVATLRTDDVCMLGWPRWSPDSTRIATGCIFVAAGVATPARVWDIASGEEVMVLESDNGWSYRTIWSPDGSRLLVAYEDGTEIIWDVESSRPVLTFAKHQGGGGVTSAWSPDGTLIVSGDYASQFIKVWNSETGEELLSFSVPGAPLTVNWSPDGTHVIVTADGMNEPLIKRIWASTDELVTHAYECCVTRELTPEERVQFGLSLATAANP